MATVGVKGLIGCSVCLCFSGCVSIRPRDSGQSTHRGSAVW